jgi:hypothetical protein
LDDEAEARRHMGRWQLISKREPNLPPAPKGGWTAATAQPLVNAMSEVDLQAIQPLVLRVFGAKPPGLTDLSAPAHTESSEK